MSENEGGHSGDDHHPTPLEVVSKQEGSGTSTPTLNNAASIEMESKMPLLKEQRESSKESFSHQTESTVITVESKGGMESDGEQRRAESSRPSSGVANGGTSPTPMSQSHVQVSAMDVGGAYPTGGGVAYHMGGGGGYGYGQGYGDRQYPQGSPYSPYAHGPTHHNPAVMDIDTVKGGSRADDEKPGPSYYMGGGAGSGPSASGRPVSATQEPEVIEDSEMEVSDMVMVGLSYMMLVLLFPLVIWQTIQVLNTYERAVIFRLGKIKSRETPTGVVFQLPCTDSVTRVDIRTRSINVPPQEILTKDSVTCRVDGIVFYDIVDPVKSVTKVEDVAQSVALSAQTALRSVLGYRTLPEILAAKLAITHDILEIVEERAHNWGVKILRVDLKDMQLAPQLQRALVAEAETARSAKAQVIRADGEHKAAEILSKASAILNDSSVGVQLRYLQTLNQISGTNNKTVVLPMPPVLAERAIAGILNAIRK